MGSLRIMKVLRFLIVPGILISLLLILSGGISFKGFDAKAYRVDRILGHIGYLDNPELGGRLAGTKGNELAVNYIEKKFKEAGVVPVKGNSLKQPCNAQVPFFGHESVFRFMDPSGKWIDKQIYKDYRYFTVGMAGGMDYSGDVLFLGRSFFDVPIEMLKGKVVVICVSGYSEDIEKRAIEAGVKGIFSYRYEEITNNPSTPVIKSVMVVDKQGSSIGSAIITTQMAHELEIAASANKMTVKGLAPSEFVGVIKNVRILQKMDFKTVKVNNVIGMIPGKQKDQYVMFSAHLDHVGNGPNGSYFPGALDNASGTAMLLEIAKWCQEQKVVPQKNIVLAAWNAEEEGLMGSYYYVKHPLIPLADTENINIDMVGGKNASEIGIAYLNPESQVLASRAYQYADFMKHKVAYVNNGGSDHYSFAQYGARSIMLVSGNNFYHQTSDTLENSIDRVNMSKVADLIGSMLKYDVYADLAPDYIKGVERAAIAYFLMVAIAVYLIGYWHFHYPEIRFWGIGSHQPYYSMTFQLFKKSLNLVLPLLMIFLLVFLSQLPKDLNMVRAGSGYDTNFSLYLTTKKTVLYLRGLATHGLGSSGEGTPLTLYILEAFMKSGCLLLGSIALALPLGLFKGIRDAYKEKKKALSGFTSILLLSVPDVLWIFIANALMVAVVNLEWSKNLLFEEGMRGWMMPWLTLSIMPFIYISRVAYVACQEEKSKPYAAALRAKGLSRKQIFRDHLMQPVLEKSVNAMNGLVAVLISNMIVVEYLFDYKGLANQVIVAKDQITSISLVMALTVLYVTVMCLFKTLALITSPRKRQKLLKQATEH